MSILLVEDNPTNALILKRLLLKAAEIEVDVVGTAIEALALVHQKAYRLLVVDHILPGAMTGLQFIQAVRMIDRYKSLPILMVSSDQQPSLLSDALDLGVFRLLRKPIDTAQFRWAVQTCLGLNVEMPRNAQSA